MTIFWTPLRPFRTLQSVLCRSGASAETEVSRQPIEKTGNRQALASATAPRPEHHHISRACKAFEVDLFDVQPLARMRLIHALSIFAGNPF